MGRISRSDKKRPPIYERIQQALNNKPSQAVYKGLTRQQILYSFGHQTPPQLRGRRGKRNQNGKDIRPSTIHRELTPWVEPSYSIFPTPNWFANHNQTDIDVSIIVPMFRSKNAIKDQIVNWDMATDNGFTEEIIYVDDACPHASRTAVIESWFGRRALLKERSVGKIIQNQINGGYSFACNVGAQYAQGKYLIFLNADCIPTPDWIYPLIELAESDETIGIIGNLQLKDRHVESAGSEWDWNMSHFPHIGKNIHNGKRLSKPYKIDQIPADLMETSEREMVTGACFLIPRKLFLDLEGFDTAYRIGYWEDADLCMKVRSAGYKIMYEPKSIVYHEVGHSKAGGHAFMNQNRDTFFKRWVKTGRIDEFVKSKRNSPIPKKSIRDSIRGNKIWGCVIACNEEEFLEVSVDSLSSVIDEWVFVIGGNEYAHKAGMCDEKGYPNDSTLEIAKNLCKKYKGRVIEPPGRLWKDKIEMRNQYATLLSPGDWMWMLDGDEVYTDNQLWRISEIMQKHDALILQFHLFWNDVNTIGTDKWDTFPQERIIRWQSGYTYNKSHLNVSDYQGNLVYSKVPCWRGKERLFYHYSWVRPIEKIRQKLLYYKFQSGNNNDSYVDNVFLKWRENPESVQGKTHPMGGGGTIPFNGIHPHGVRKLIEEGKLNF